MSVGLLGPLDVSVDGRPVTLTQARLRTVLAVLAMSAGDTVPVSRLGAAIWDDDWPANARRTIQTYVARLRSALAPGLIVSSPAGYLLRAEPDQVDALRFLRLLDAAAAEPETPAERTRLAEAIGLWRGTPFADVPSPSLESSQAPRLAEAYLAAVERQADLLLADGRHAELAGPLRELVGQYPLRESLWVRLLVALHRGGRQAESLEAYEALRKRLADELGTDPGPDLRRVHADLLAGREPGSGYRVTRNPVPRQLPVGSDSFTGRETELASLTGILRPADGTGLRDTAICAISGMPGIGKTALAVRAAHQLAGEFPDGQLYLDLQGATPGLPPLQPLEALGRFLRALGADPSAIPGALDEASAAFRSWVAGRRVLVLLDNAADAAQVVPLLPAAQGCAVLVTSRRVLATLDGATHLQLGVLAPGEALELLGRMAGPERLAADPAAAAVVARYCGYLPLALRIAGARLTARPAWPLRALVDLLADEERRLAELEVAEAQTRASFTASLRHLRASGSAVDDAAAEAFTLLGVLDGPDVSTPVAERLLDVPRARAQTALERLADAQLLLPTAAPGRYRLHDLLRLYARELARERHDEPARAAALARVLRFYVATAWRTLELLRPGDYLLERADDSWRQGGLEFASDTEALRWLDRERANLLAAARQAADAPGAPRRAAVLLAQSLFGFFWLRNHWDDWIEVNQVALRAARDIGDVAGQAKAHNDAAGGYLRLGRYAEAEAALRESLAIRRQLGDCQGEGACLANLGVVAEWQGRFEEALEYQEQSLAIDRELGDRRGQAETLGNAATACLQLGRYTEAVSCLREALAIERELGDKHGEASDLATLGRAYSRLGHYAEAMACLQEGLEIDRGLGDRDGVANCLVELGVVYRLQGAHEESLASLGESLAIRRELGDGNGQAESLRELGETARALGRPAHARAHWTEALACYEALCSPSAEQVRGLIAALPATPPGGAALAPPGVLVVAAEP